MKNECALVDERARAEDDRRRTRREQLKTPSQPALASLPRAGSRVSVKYNLLMCSGCILV